MINEAGSALAAGCVDNKRKSSNGDLQYYGSLSCLFLPLTIVFVIAGNDEVRCIIIVAP